MILLFFYFFSLFSTSTFSYQYLTFFPLVICLFLIFVTFHCSYFVFIFGYLVCIRFGNAFTFWFSAQTCCLLWWSLDFKGSTSIRCFVFNLTLICKVFSQPLHFYVISIPISSIKFCLLSLPSATTGTALCAATTWATRCTVRASSRTRLWNRATAAGAPSSSRGCRRPPPTPWSWKHTTRPDRDRPRTRCTSPPWKKVRSLVL